MFRRIGIFILLLAIAVTGVYGVTNYLANVRINALQEQNQQLVDENNKYIALLAESKNLLTIAQKDLADNKKELEEALTTISAKTAQIETLCVQVVEIETTLETKNVELAEKENTIEILNNSLTASNARYDEITEELTTANTQLSEAQKDIEANASEIETLELQISNLTSEKEALIVDIATKETTIANLTAEKTTIENEKQELQTTLTTKENQIAELEEEIANSNVEELEAQIAEQEATINELTAEVEYYSKIISLSQNTEMTGTCDFYYDITANCYTAIPKEDYGYIQNSYMVFYRMGNGSDYLTEETFNSYLEFYKEHGANIFYTGSNYAQHGPFLIDTYINNYDTYVSDGNTPIGYYVWCPVGEITEGFTDTIPVTGSSSVKSTIIIGEDFNNKSLDLFNQSSNYSISITNCHLKSLAILTTTDFNLSFSGDYFIDTLYLSADFIEAQNENVTPLSEEVLSHVGKIVYLPYTTTQFLRLRTTIQQF